MTPTYNVRTWDAELGEYTPQEGMRNPCLGVDILGLRRALRELRAECGYTCNRVRLPGGDYDSDPAVLVERAAKNQP